MFSCTFQINFTPLEIWILHLHNIFMSSTQFLWRINSHFLSAIPQLRQWCIQMVKFSKTNMVFISSHSNYTYNQTYWFSSSCNGNSKLISYNLIGAYTTSIPSMETCQFAMKPDGWCEESLWRIKVGQMIYTTS